MMMYTIWQRFRDSNAARTGWGLWAATHHQDLTEEVAKERLVEILADEMEIRERCPGTEAEYELRPSTRQMEAA